MLHNRPRILPGNPDTDQRQQTMHDIRQIRENPTGFDAALARRGLPAMAAEILAIDENRRSRILAAETAQAERNAASKDIGAAKARGDQTEF